MGVTLGALAEARSDSTGRIPWKRGLIYAGRTAGALPVLTQALDLDPRDSADATVYRCFAYLNLHREAEAVGPCETSAARYPVWTRYMLLTAVYANLGNMQAAAKWKNKLMDANPKITVQRVRDMRTTNSPRGVAEIERWLEGLRKAGVPEK